MPQTVVFSKTVTLTDAQIKALPTTPFELVANPGAGKTVILLQSVFGRLNDTAGVYTNADNSASSFLLVTQGSDWSGDASLTFTNLSDFVAGLTAGQLIPLPSFNNAGVGINAAIDKGLFVYADNNGLGNLTGGNAANTLIVTVLYVIIDV